MARMDAACHRPAHRAHAALLLVAVAALLFTGCTTGSRSTLDTFRLITIFFVLVIPLVAFLRVKKKSKEEVAASMKAAAESH